MKFALPQLNYKLDSLSPSLSEETLDYHYNKHHKTYIDNLNNLIIWTEFENKTLEEIIISSKNWPIFNNSAQVWNHTFYFEQFCKKNTNKDLKIIEKIEETWGNFDDFKNEFNKKALANFGSWWTWLILNQGKLDIINTSNASNTLDKDELKPLLTCDVWEHAYYIDYRNSRANYLNNFWEIIDWNIIEKRFLW